MTLESLLSALSHSEKLDAMDLLWRDLTSVPAKYASPDWHEEVLNRRLANPESAPRLPLSEAEAEVKERLRARRT